MRESVPVVIYDPAASPPPAIPFVRATLMVNLAVSYLFEQIEQHAIRYCLLREGDDIDLLVAASDLPLLETLLGERGWIRLPVKGHAPHHFFVTYKEAEGQWFKLDVVTELCFGDSVHPLRTTLGERCLAHRRHEAGRFVPAPEEGLMALLLHCLLDKGTFPPDYQHTLKALCGEVGREQYMEELLAEYAPPLGGWPQLAENIRQDKWGALLAVQHEVEEGLRKRDPLGTLGRQVGRRLQRRLSTLHGLLRPTGWSVTLLAADGAGKSTLTARLQEGFCLPVHTTYMGLYSKQVDGAPKRRLPTGVGLLAKLAIQWGRYLQGRYQQAHGKLVIFDRYPYDALLPLPHSSSWPERARRWLLANSCPAPNQIIILDAPADVLRHRKPEHSIAELDDKRRSYLALQGRLPHAVVVNVNRDLQELYREISSLIWEQWSQHLTGGEER